jgi:hypothetical protein
MQPKFVSMDTVLAEYIPHVVELVGSHDQPNQVRLSSEALDECIVPNLPGRFRRFIRVRARLDDASDLIAKGAANLLQRLLATLISTASCKSAAIASFSAAR